MSDAKLILLHGFAGLGKTTIAERYASQHPLAMDLEGDRIIVLLGQWLKHETAARELLFKLGKTMTRTCLQAGHSVVVPMLPTHLEPVKSFERIAQETGVQCFQVVLVVDRKEAIRRLLKRGTWGEEGSPPLTKADLPFIEKLYDDMDCTLGKLPDAVRIPCVEDEHDATYQQFLAAIHEI
jgi:predicted kinase